MRAREPSLRDLPVAAARSQAETQTPLHAGAPLPPAGTQSPYQENGWGQAEGRRLFVAYNCSGCHANGGGGIGPPLMDDEWIYGFAPGNVYSAIVEGRPNGGRVRAGGAAAAAGWSSRPMPSRRVGATYS